MERYTFHGAKISEHLHFTITKKTKKGEEKLIQSVKAENVHYQRTLNYRSISFIETILFEGNHGIKSKVMSEKLSLKEGEFLSLSKVSTGTTELTRLYLERGYSEVTIESDYTIDEKTNKITLTYSINEGIQSKVDQINFIGVETYIYSSKSEVSAREFCFLFIFDRSIE